MLQLVPEQVYECQGIENTIRAAVSAQLDATLASIAAEADGQTERVHSARKDLKRWRALFGLLPSSTRAKLQREHRIIRLVARSLGRVRDPVARLETWQKFVRAQPAQDALDSVTSRLEQTAAAETGEARVERRLRRAERALLGVRRGLVRVFEGPVVPEIKARSALARAAAQSYRRARRAFRNALEEPSSESLHLLRRATKAHQYQLQFLEPLWKPLKSQREEAANLSEIIGEHHDLAGIEQGLTHSATRAAHPWNDARRTLEDLQRELEYRAFHAASYVYAERPRAFRRRLRCYLQPVFRGGEGSSDGGLADDSSEAPAGLRAT